MMNFPFNPQQPGMPGQGTGMPYFPPGNMPGPGTFPGAPVQPVPLPGTVPGGVGQPGTSMLPIEQSFIENILRLNLGKIATIYLTYENNTEWNAKVFRGRLEAAGRDHIIISDPTTGMRYLLLMVNVDYITFDEPLNYYYPFTGAVAQTPSGFPPSTTGR